MIRMLNKYLRKEYRWGGPEGDWHYIFVNWEDKDYVFHDGVNRPIRTLRWEFSRFWYDGAHCQLNLWRIIIGWSTPYTIPPFEFCSAYEQWKWMQKPRWWRKLWCMEPYEDAYSPSGSPSVLIDHD